MTTPNPSTVTAAIPDGFKPLAHVPDGLFTDTNGPLYRKREADRFVLGMRVERRHCNPTLICHGGMLMTFVDMAMVMTAIYQGRLANFLPTVSLTADFLAAAPLGSWIEARTDLLNQTRNMVFAQCLVTNDGKPVTRASAVFKIGPEFQRPPRPAAERGAGQG